MVEGNHLEGNVKNLYPFVNYEAKSLMVAIEVQHVEKLGIVQWLDVNPTIIVCCIMRYIKRYLQQLHQILTSQTCYKGIPKLVAVHRCLDLARKGSLS